MLDSRRFTYFSLLLLCLATIALLAITGLSPGFSHVGTGVCLWFITPFLPYAVYRSEGIRWLDRTICGFECFGLFFLISFIGCLASYPMAAMSSGWADAYLLSGDRVMGLQWLDYWNFSKSHPLFFELLGKAYMCIAYTPAAIIAALAGTGNFDRLYRFLAVHLVCLVVTDVSLMFVPATSAIAHFLPSHGAGLPMAGIRPIGIIQGLRDGTLSTVELTDLTGLIAVPSFHAEACVLYTWAVWGLGKARLPFLVVNGMMMLSTPIIGGHYFTDVAAGILVAVAVIAASACLKPSTLSPRMRGMGGPILRPAVSTV
jgi:hypothetical protein